MKSHHMQHHYKEPNMGFGVTSRIWDWVFGASPSFSRLGRFSDASLADTDFKPSAPAKA